jgi:hypothetical protein
VDSASVPLDQTVTDGTGGYERPARVVMRAFAAAGIAAISNGRYDGTYVRGGVLLLVVALGAVLGALLWFVGVSVG